MTRPERLFLAGLIFLSTRFFAVAQQTMIYREPEATFRAALELFEKEKYAMAREKFLWVADQIPEPGLPARIRAEYLAAVCGYELFNHNADLALEQVIASHKTSTIQPHAALVMGKLEYRKGNYRQAIAHLTRVKRTDLEHDARDEFFFKLGYSYLRTQDLKEASANLALIKDTSSLYFAPATYFRSHIAYTNKEYKKALSGFGNLRKDPTFKGIVPYYIAQIHYLQQDFDDLLAIGPGLLETATVRRGPEIARMIGEAYYQRKNYEQAIPYLDQYFQKTRSGTSRHDEYTMAYACYQAGQYSRAIEHFNKVVTESDTLTQNAFYHLADCYLKTGQKKFALNAFQSAYKEGYAFPVKEDALFNYAKLSYELSYNPYNEAGRALRQYIREYPESKRLDEANTYLVNLYISNKNYKEALASLENIRQKNQPLRQAYQRLNYFRGIEEFNDGKFDEANSYFATAASSSDDPGIRAASVYWQAECKYRKGLFSEAIEGYRQFQVTPGAFSLPEYPLADYNTGYCNFKLKAYEKAIVSFRKFHSSKDRVEARLLNDSYLRTGDCYFVTKGYDEAVRYYALAASLRMHDGDYAVFQQALAQGAAGDLQEKAATLTGFTTTHTRSSLLPQARYELGITWLALRQDEKALRAFDDLMKNHPGSHQVRDALLRSGLIYYNQDKNELALSTFKQVVSDYPGTPESKEALMSIRNIYVDLNRVDDFFVYAKNLPFSNVSDAEQDSLTYLAAENRYMAHDCNSATRGFRDYLGKFSQGIFRTQAHFYLAECLFRNNQADEALASYTYVIGEPRSRFTETSLLNASSIYYSRKDYANALTCYSRMNESAELAANILAARTGIMRCHFNLEQYRETLGSTRQLITTDQAPAELVTEAWLTQAKAAMKLDSLPLAKTAFEKTYEMAKNEMGAEAKFNLAAIAFLSENYKEAEKIIFEFINEFPSYDFWLARSFILLADVYVKLDNIIQAKQTLQSIIDNYEGPDLGELAKNKLNAILDSEKAEALRKEEEARKAQAQQPDTIIIDQ